MLFSQAVEKRERIGVEFECENQRLHASIVPQNARRMWDNCSIRRPDWSFGTPKILVAQDFSMPLEDNSKIVPLSDADFAAAKTDVADLIVKVTPLLRHFTPEYIKRLTKYGDKSDAFVASAESAVSAVGSDLPGAFNAQDFHDYVLVMHQIEEILGPVATLFDGLSDAKMLIGSFLMQNSNFVYGQLKQVENLDPRVVPYVDEMKKRYAGQGPHKPAPPMS